MLQQYGGIQAYVLRIRRDLHKIPEIGLELPDKHSNLTSYLLLLYSKTAHL